LRLAGQPELSIDLCVRLDGEGGGTWERMVGSSPGWPVAISGPAWAWITWAPRREPAHTSGLHLAHGSDNVTSLVMRTARSFA